MRTSKKDMLITTAIGIIEKDGLDALTYESLSAASGLSKSGLIYHFPSRRAMLLEINTFLSNEWEQKLLEVAGDKAENLNRRDRAQAALEVLSQNASRADLLITLETAHDPEFQDMWNSLMAQWTYPTSTILSDPKKYLVHVIADGLWVHDHINHHTLNDEERNALIQAAKDLLDE